MFNLASHFTKLIVAFLRVSSCHSSPLQEVLNSMFDVLFFFLSVSIFFLTERSVKETPHMLKRKCFFSQVNSQIYEQGWFPCDLLRNHGKKNMALKSLPASDVH